jgi:hypothetical protein
VTVFNTILCAVLNWFVFIVFWNIRKTSDLSAMHFPNVFRIYLLLLACRQHFHKPFGHIWDFYINYKRSYGKKLFYNLVDTQVFFSKIIAFTELNLTICENAVKEGKMRN